LKIAVIEPSGRLYGSEYCLLDIVDGLPQRDYSWCVFLPQGAGLDKLLLDRGIGCEFLIPRKLGKLPNRQKVPVYLKIMWRLIQIKPDLLYVNQTGSLRSVAVYARCLNLPVVCQVQTLEDAHWLSSRPGLHRRVQAFICNSQFIADETDCDDKKKCILYQGISPVRLENARAQRVDSGRKKLEAKEEGTVTVGILGRIALSKGHYLLLEAAKKLKSELPNCRFVVIGEGLTSKDTNEFKKAVAGSGLDPVFEFRGYRKDLAPELARLDMLVIPSLAEPLGRVLFDAAEYGVPVVLSDTGGLGEISKRFDVGLRFKTGDAEAFSRAIIEAASQYESTRTRFISSSVSMLQRLSMKTYLASIERIFLAAVDRKFASEVWLGDV